MTEKLNIVQSTTEPDKRNIWLKDNELKKFGAKGWSTIGGSNSSGGDTDKQSIIIPVDMDTHEIIIDNKRFSYTTDNAYFKMSVVSEELFDILCNRLFGKTINVYISIVSNNINMSTNILTSWLIINNNDYNEHSIYFDFISQSNIGYINIIK